MLNDGFRQDGHQVCTHSTIYLGLETNHCIFRTQAIMSFQSAHSDQSYGKGWKGWKTLQKKDKIYFWMF